MNVLTEDQMVRSIESSPDLANVSHLNHGGVDARSQALDLRESEHVVLGRLADFEVQRLFDGVEDLVRASEPARGGGADLDVVLACRVPHEHGVEGGHLVDAHPGHSDELGHVMHRGYGQPPVLPLQHRNKTSNQAA